MEKHKEKLTKVSQDLRLMLKCTDVAGAPDSLESSEEIPK